MIRTIGKIIVGYRYGEAPENGKSWNYRERCFEPGVSMACVGYDKEIGSFAVSEALKRKKFYYIGKICGTGGDDEICLEDVVRISYKEYLKLRRVYIETSNQVVNDRIDTKIRLKDKGWDIPKTYEELEREREKYLRK